MTTSEPGHSLRNVRKAPYLASAFALYTKGVSLPFTDHFICFAHRGASGTTPENTLLSFSRALELGARWIELDLRVVEGELVVFHDRTLKRRAGVAGIIEKQSLATLRTLDVGEGERIPLFSEVLALTKGRARLQVELKGQGTGEVTAHVLNDLTSQGWAPDTFLVSSFDHEEMATFTRLAPTIPVGLLLYGYPLNALSMARTLKAYSVHLHLETVTPKRVGLLHEAGFKVFVYTVNEPSDIAAMRSIGVDGVFSDFPERVITR